MARFVTFFVAGNKNPEISSLWDTRLNKTEFQRLQDVRCGISLYAPAVTKGVHMRFRLGNIAFWRHAVSEPYVAANGRTLANCDPTEHSRAGINHDVVFDYRMT